MIRIYYLATAAFLLLDWLFGINVRVAFFDTEPLWRAAYYALMFGCLAVVVWQPALTSVVGLVESLLSLSALILGMGARVMVPVDPTMDGLAAPVTVEEIINFMIAGAVGYFSYTRAMHRLQQDKNA